MRKISFLIWLSAFFATSAYAQMHVGGELKEALAERLASDPSTTVEGRIYWNTSSKQLIIHDGTSYRKPNTWTASEIAFIPVGSLSATDLQGALTEVDTALGGVVIGSSTDNAVVRWSGTGGDTTQDSVVIIDDLGVVTGVTQLDVDNLRLDGNVLSAISGNVQLGSTLDPNGNEISGSGALQIDNVRVDANTVSTVDTNGNLILSPNGTGVVSTTSPVQVNSFSGNWVSGPTLAVDGKVEFQSSEFVVQKTVADGSYYHNVYMERAAETSQWADWEINMTAGDIGDASAQLNGQKDNTRRGNITVGGSTSQGGWGELRVTNENINRIDKIRLDPTGVLIEAGDNAIADTSPTRPVTIRTGNKTVGTGDSGNVTISTGNATGNAGSIVMIPGTGATNGIVDIQGRMEVDQLVVDSFDTGSARYVSTVQTGDFVGTGRVEYFSPNVVFQHKSDVVGDMTLYNSDATETEYSAVEVYNDSAGAQYSAVMEAKNTDSQGRVFISHFNAGADTYVELSANNGGEIRLNNGSTPTVGYVWTSENVNGAGTWAINDLQTTYLNGSTVTTTAANPVTINGNIETTGNVLAISATGLTTGKALDITTSATDTARAINTNGRIEAVSDVSSDGKIYNTVIPGAQGSIGYFHNTSTTTGSGLVGSTSAGTADGLSLPPAGVVGGNQTTTPQGAFFPDAAGVYATGANLTANGTAAGLMAVSDDGYGIHAWQNNGTKPAIQAYSLSSHPANTPMFRIYNGSTAYSFIEIDNRGNYYTADDATANATATSPLSFYTGDKTAGTGGTGNLSIGTGDSTGGPSGSISISTGTSSTTRGDVILDGNRVVFSEGVTTLNVNSHTANQGMSLSYSGGSRGLEVFSTGSGTQSAFQVTRSTGSGEAIVGINNSNNINDPTIKVWNSSTGGNATWLGFLNNDFSTIGIGMPSTGVTSYKIKLPPANGTTKNVLRYSNPAGDLEWAIPELADDPSPQLSGDLDLNGFALIIAGSTSGSVTVQAPATVNSDYTITLPEDPPASAGQVLVNQGSGTLVWGTVTPVEALVNDEAGAITLGQVVFVNSSGNVELANSDTITKSELIGVVAEASIAAAATGGIQFAGKAGGFSGLTVGAPVYVNSTDGTVTQNASSIPTDDRLYLLGKAMTATEVFVAPEYQERIINYDTDVGVGGVTEVTVADNLSIAKRIEVKINGMEYREGGSNDYTVDTGLNKILFTFTVPENAFIRVTVFQ